MRGPDPTLIIWDPYLALIMRDPDPSLIMWDTLALVMSETDPSLTMRVRDPALLTDPVPQALII